MFEEGTESRGFGERVTRAMRRAFIGKGGGGEGGMGQGGQGGQAQGYYYLNEDDDQDQDDVTGCYDAYGAGGGVGHANTGGWDDGTRGGLNDGTSDTGGWDKGSQGSGEGEGYEGEGGGYGSPALTARGTPRSSPMSHHSSPKPLMSADKLRVSDGGIPTLGEMDEIVLPGSRAQMEIMKLVGGVGEKEKVRVFPKGGEVAERNQDKPRT